LRLVYNQPHSIDTAGPSADYTGGMALNPYQSPRTPSRNTEPPKPRRALPSIPDELLIFAGWFVMVVAAFAVLFLIMFVF
jgi:hypothetical protein